MACNHWKNEDTEYPYSLLKTLGIAKVINTEDGQLVRGANIVIKQCDFCKKIILIYEDSGLEISIN